MTVDFNGLPPYSRDNKIITQAALAISKEVSQHQKEAVEQLRREALEPKDDQTSQKAREVQAVADDSAKSGGADGNADGQENGSDNKDSKPPHLNVTA